MADHINVRIVFAGEVQVTLPEKSVQKEKNI